MYPSLFPSDPLSLTVLRSLYGSNLFLVLDRVLCGCSWRLSTYASTIAHDTPSEFRQSNI
jgi:hypothetical protein